MRVETLSDHAGGQLQKAEAALQEHHRRVAAHQAAVKDLRTRHVASRRWWQIGKRLAQRQELRQLQFGGPVLDERLVHRRAQQQAGVTAESHMTSALLQLSDDWLLFCGYTNRKGEVDRLLVGPGGVWAIEVKGRGVRVHVQGDRWTFEKFDRYGNLVGSGVLADAGGRSWGRQVSEVAAALGEFLRSRGVRVPIRTTVAVINGRASLGTFDSAGIDMLSIGPEYLLQRIRSEPPALSPEQCAEIARLVRRDHAFHSRSRDRQHRRR
ncbi:nuclease-related domain-containing protein [Streptomyces tauricus]|uniref:nuclease-related domain-containing protein n=1 Tax=Streptomyces tauricus TaxID=68274 RepID=UPI002242ECBD|nr:nuclease-related domain-containing protein [Streptomyces tauricus]MCW8103448.1 NERD domain-containing protein [Streptomyces tauricus]